MSLPNTSLPLPMYTIDDQLLIVGMNQSAINSLTAGTSILDVIEEESREKVERHLQQAKAVESLEINVISNDEEILLADLYASWIDDSHTAEVVIVKKDQAIQKVSEQLGRLRTRLNETNFELLDAKEAAENLLHENIKLSSPFIELTDAVAVVPVFGELDENKSKSIAKTLTERAYQSDADILIIDFTAVGTIAEGGIFGFKELVSMLQLLGFTLIVAGLHPHHVKLLHGMGFAAEVHYVNSLRLAIEYTKTLE